MTQATMTIGQGNIIRETAKAILVNVDIKEVWLPKSQISVDIPAAHIAGTLTMPYWLARKNFTYHEICQLRMECK